MQRLAAVRGADAVLAEFGGAWPSFHDAEVIRFAIERTEKFGVVATLRVHVRRYESRAVGTVDYHQALVQSVFIDFRFTGVEDLSITDFNEQNVIDDIAVSRDAGAPMTVEIPGIYGFDATWKCRDLEVTSVLRGAL